MNAETFKLWDHYQRWLIDQLRFENPDHYYDLFRILHNKEFICVIDRDQNRAEDGLYLRNYFFQEIGCSGGHFDEDLPCSVLEMLVALSKRINDEYIGDPGNPRPDIIFFEMLKNLGLHRFTGSCSHRDKNLIDDILDRFLQRRYASNGRGGLFPIRHNRADQRNIEIWFQMIHYIHENY